MLLASFLAHALGFAKPEFYSILKEINQHIPFGNSWKFKILMDGWDTSFLLGWPIFRGKLLVYGRVGFSRFVFRSVSVVLF